MSRRHADKAVRKYLDGHAERSARFGAGLGQSFKQVVVIPAYGENQILDRAIDSIPGSADEPTLAIVVVNQRDNSPGTIKLVNDATWERLRTRFHVSTRQGAQDRHDVDSSSNALLRQTPFGTLALVRTCLPDDQGVGLARKYGADMALGAWAAGLIESSWIHCTDADVQLPGDYFSPLPSGAVAALHRFRHIATQDTAEPVRIYDAWLRLHVLGLHWAGSPYAFHTIGSTITVNARNYAQVRGFPRRNAAEDFHFLNKLAKTGLVTAATSAPLKIAARVSDRVPFGTGRAIGLAQREGLAAMPRFYHPRVYEYLKAVLDELERCSTAGCFNRRALACAVDRRQLDPAPLGAALNALGIDSGVEKAIRSSTGRETRRHALHCWFDAFRTMKFVHHLRDNGVDSVDMETALAEGQFLLHKTEAGVQDDIAAIRGESVQGI